MKFSTYHSAASLLALHCVAACWLSPQVSANTLTGGIEHAEKLPSASENLKPGKAFEDKLITKARSGNWFEIPGWLAGTWQSIQVIQLSNYDCRTGKTDSNTTIVPANETETFGYQVDNRQNIWTLKQSATPIISAAEVADQAQDKQPGKEPRMIPLTKYTLRENTLTESNDKEVVFKSLDTIVSVRSDTKTIYDVEQRESIRRVADMQNDVVAVTSDVQTYDRFGFPQTRLKLAEFRKRSRDFKVVDEIKGGSLYASFKNFLQEEGKLNLAPSRKPDDKP